MGWSHSADRVFLLLMAGRNRALAVNQKPSTSLTAKGLIVCQAGPLTSECAVPCLPLSDTREAEPDSEVVSLTKRREGVQGLLSSGQLVQK